VKRGDGTARLFCPPCKLSVVCCSLAPQALTQLAGLQSAKSHAITLGRPLVSYPIEVPLTAEAYAVRAPLHMSELRSALSADASTRVHDRPGCTQACTCAAQVEGTPADSVMLGLSNSLFKVLQLAACLAWLVCGF